MLAAAAGGWWSLAGSAPTGYDFDADPGPALVPRLLLAALGAGGAVLAGLGLRGLRRAAGARQASTPGLARGGPPLLPALFVATLAGYLVILPALGYLAATLLFSAGWILALAGRERSRAGPRAWALALGGGLAVTLTLYGIFRGFVRVPLP
jgi:hypothetical protein